MGHNESDCVLAIKERREKGKCILQYGSWLRVPAKQRGYKGFSTEGSAKGNDFGRSSSRDGKGPPRADQGGVESDWRKEGAGEAKGNLVTLPSLSEVNLEKRSGNFPPLLVKSSGRNTAMQEAKASVGPVVMSTSGTKETKKMGAAPVGPNLIKGAQAQLEREAPAKANIGPMSIVDPMDFSIGEIRIENSELTHISQIIRSDKIEGQKWKRKRRGEMEGKENEAVGELGDGPGQKRGFVEEMTGVADEAPKKRKVLGEFNTNLMAVAGEQPRCQP